MFRDLIVRTRLCVTGLITQSGWLFHFHRTKMIRRKHFVQNRYELPKGTSAGLALQCFYMIHRVGRTKPHSTSFFWSHFCLWIVCFTCVTVTWFRRTVCLSFLVVALVQEAFRAWFTSPFLQRIGCLTKVICSNTDWIVRVAALSAERTDDSFMLLN